MASPGKGSLTLGGKVPALARTIRVAIPHRQVAVSGSVTILNTNSVVASVSGSLTLTGLAPLATMPGMAVVFPGTDQLALTGKAPLLPATTETVQPAVGSLTLTGKAPTTWVVTFYSGSITLPRMTSTGQLTAGAFFSGNVELPALIASQTLGYRGTVTRPLFSVDSALQVGSGYTGYVSLPALDVDATASLDQVFSGAITLPSLRASGTLFLDVVFNGNVTLPLFDVDGTYLRDVVFSGAITLPALQADGSLLVGVVFNGDVELPLYYITAAFTDNTTLLYAGWAINTFRRAFGKYDNVEFTGMGRLGVRTYAAMSDGLYRLDGEDDAGETIDAEFLTGFEDFGVEAVKGQRVAYLGLSSDGPVELLIRTDTDGQDIFSYPVDAPHETAAGSAPARIKLGRGLRGRYWQVGLRNIKGADFDLDRIGMGVWASTRKR